MSLEIALTHAFPGFSLDVRLAAPGGVLALFGRSGSGKTTVTNAVAGLLRPDAGRIVVDGRVLLDTEARVFVPPHRRRIGYVFQDGRLFPHLDVRANLLYARRFAGLRAAPATTVADLDRVVALLGIGHLLERRPAALSGGEKQRVAIGRALLADPALLLMDEPLAALDDARKAEILPYLERVRDEACVPILYVSHSVAEVARLATTVAVMEAGRIVRAGPATEILSDPQAVPAFGVREAGAVLHGTLVAHHDDGLSEVRLSAGVVYLPRIDAAPGARVRLRILARDVTLALDPPGRISALNVLPARITALHEGRGPSVVVSCAVGDGTLLARVTRRSARALGLAEGMPCHCIVEALAFAGPEVGSNAGSGAPEEIEIR